jgi:DNA invertase Pin-like site-specific DNA recombinase
MSQFQDLPPPWNEILKDFMVNVFGWIAEEESNTKSQRVRAAYKNHDGKKWGRPKKDIKTQKVLRLRQQGESLRSIGKQLGVSRTTVSRILKRHKKGA